MGYTTLMLERTGAIATITLNRPDVRNALDLVMRGELLSALDEVEADPEARVLILTGAGGHFCAGGDVKTMRARRQTAAEGRQRVEALNRMVLRLVDFPRPTIAQVDGFAVGAGCNLALARAKELIFTADIIDAAEAGRIGLVNRVVPAAELEPVTRALATRIAQGPPKVLAMAKHMVNRAAATDLASALDVEAFSQAIATTGDEHREGLAAFFEKRPPKFTGR